MNQFKHRDQIRKKKTETAASQKRGKRKLEEEGGREFSPVVATVAGRGYPRYPPIVLSAPFFATAVLSNFGPIFSMPCATSPPVPTAVWPLPYRVQPSDGRFCLSLSFVLTVLNFALSFFLGHVLSLSLSLCAAHSPSPIFLLCMYLGVRVY